MTSHKNRVFWQTQACPDQRMQGTAPDDDPV
jgi:hypothetical protein